MAEVSRALESPAPEEGKPMDYDAFPSYAHRDKQVTTATQKGLHQIGRRLGGQLLQSRALTGRADNDVYSVAFSPDQRSHRVRQLG